MATQIKDARHNFFHEKVADKLIRALPDTKSESVIHNPVQISSKLISPLCSAPNHLEVKSTSNVPDIKPKTLEINE